MSPECVLVHRILVPLKTEAGPAGSNFAVVGYQGLGEDGSGQVEIFTPRCGW